MDTGHQQAKAPHVCIGMYCLYPPHMLPLAPGVVGTVVYSDLSASRITSLLDSGHSPWGIGARTMPAYVPGVCIMKCMTLTWLQSRKFHHIHTLLTLHTHIQTCSRARELRHRGRQGRHVGATATGKVPTHSGRSSYVHTYVPLHVLCRSLVSWGKRREQDMPSIMLPSPRIVGNQARRVNRCLCGCILRTEYTGVCWLVKVMYVSCARCVCVFVCVCLSFVEQSHYILWGSLFCR